MDKLPAHLVKVLPHINYSGLEAIGGELKNLMYDVEQEMIGVDESKHLSLPDLKYLNGKFDAYVVITQLVYLLYAEGAK